MERTKTHFQNVFALFCDETNLMPSENIVKALRSAGYVVDDAFVVETPNAHVSLEDFMEFVLRAQMTALSKEKIEEAFKFYDPGETGYIKATEFKRILSTGPDALSESDISIVLEAFPPNDQGLMCYTLPISYIFDNEW